MIRSRRPTWLSLIASLLIATLFSACSNLSPTPNGVPETNLTPLATTGGPLVLMGIDAEDGGVGGHGPISVYADVANSILAATSNGGSGILVVGGSSTNCGYSDVTAFWSSIGTAVGQTITLVNDAANISAQSFTGFKMIGVASSESDTFCGGLTDAENEALIAKAADLADFVNTGGGLFAFSAGGLTRPYGYLDQIGTFTFNFTSGYDFITPTAEGTALGISTALNVCCWHDEYATFPSFLKVLATNSSTGNAAAIGALRAVLPGSISLDPLTATNPVGTSHTVTASVRDTDGNPLQGALISFSVISGPNMGVSGSGTSNSSGQVSYSYTSNGTAGTDTIEASFTDATGTLRRAQATKVWEAVGTPTPGNQGCTPGYWKNRGNRINSWAATGYAQSNLVSSVFDTTSFSSLGSKSLLRALDFRGGSTMGGAAEIMLRAATAALLNAAHPDVAYPMAASAVIADVNAALQKGTGETDKQWRSRMLTLATQLDDQNNLGCPLGN